MMNCRREPKSLMAVKLAQSRLYLSDEKDDIASFKDGQGVLRFKRCVWDIV